MKGSENCTKIQEYWGKNSCHFLDNYEINTSFFQALFTFCNSLDFPSTNKSPPQKKKKPDLLYITDQLSMMNKTLSPINHFG